MRNAEDTFAEMKAGNTTATSATVCHLLRGLIFILCFVYILPKKITQHINLISVSIHAHAHTNIPNSF